MNKNISVFEYIERQIPIRNWVMQQIGSNKLNDISTAPTDRVIYLITRQGTLFHGSYKVARYNNGTTQAGFECRCICGCLYTKDKLLAWCEYDGSIDYAIKLNLSSYDIERIDKLNLIKGRESNIENKMEKL